MPYGPHSRSNRVQLLLEGGRTRISKETYIATYDFPGVGGVRTAMRLIHPIQQNRGLAFCAHTRQAPFHSVMITESIAII